MNFHLQTLGCRLNEAELATWTRHLHQRGHAVTRVLEDADVAVVNSCAVTMDAARSSRRIVRRLHRDNPRLRIVVTGCLATLEPETVSPLPGVDLVVPNADKHVLVDQMLQALLPGTMPVAAMDAPPVPLAHDRRRRAFVKVQDGCRNRCSFCVVTVARGEERSRPIAEVVDEVGALVDAGRREVVLTGVHLGGYGSDLDTDLRQLVRALLQDTDVQRLRLGSLEPWDIPAGFFGLWDDPRLLPHLHLPAQSGSASVLRRMRRRCTPDAYARLVQAARTHIPGLNLTTDLIVGFPGETPEEHDETLAFVDRMGFGDAHLFVWSPRPGTRAATLPDRVPRPIGKARSAALNARIHALKQRTLSAAMGLHDAVLIESLRTVDGTLVGRGHTRNYLPARVQGVGPLDVGRVVDIVVARTEADAVWGHATGA